MLPHSRPGRPDKRFHTLKIIPNLVAGMLWAPALSEKFCALWCDNMAVVRFVNAQTSKSLKVMHPVLHFMLHDLNFYILFSTKHVPGLFSEIAGALSCFQFHTF